MIVETPNTAVDDNSFEFFASFLKKFSGYNLVVEKKYLLESRLGDVLKTHQLPDSKAIIEKLRINPYGALANDVIEAMTVNETFFFRDQSPFETFEQKILPNLSSWAKDRPYRIWSAACSTGQEPYSLAMIIEKNRERYPALAYDIVATDINNRVLAHARQGLYTDLEVNRGLPDIYRTRYFTRQDPLWRINDSVRSHITFCQLNLLGAYDMPGQFDLVLLRNVLIYFDALTKESILRKVSQKMAENGYLLLGAAEGIYDPGHYFQRCDEIKGLYRRVKTG